jgi:hypothetical protein
MAWELFGVAIYHAELHSFQSFLANYYRPTYQQIIERMKSGSILHADETSAGVRGDDNGYVWVIATMQEVAYLYHKSREGDYIRSLLGTFHGVLISDFFAAYDGIDCVKQKCLIHLIRDLNDDLIGNPYDEELQCIAREFGAVLKAIVATIDLYGLKQRHLAKHEQAVERFFGSLEGRPIESEVADHH